MPPLGGKGDRRDTAWLAWPGRIHLSREPAVSDSPRTVVVLAAGEGKRMKSSLPKVLHPLLGRTLLGHVLAAAAAAGAERTVVVGGARRRPGPRPPRRDRPGATAVLQAEQLGTGHAARSPWTRSPTPTGTVLVLNGDVPLLRAATVADLVRTHEDAGAAATVLTAEVADPTGLGRIVRDGAGAFAAIVEERDADAAAARASAEINAGHLRVRRRPAARGARQALHRQRPGRGVPDRRLRRCSWPPVTRRRARRRRRHRDARLQRPGASWPALRRLLRDRINGAWMRAGVTLLDPADHLDRRHRRPWTATP